jgi:hypothetical protein
MLKTAVCFGNRGDGQRVKVIIRLNEAAERVPQHKNDYYGKHG